jgi:hypothetical protein
MTKVLIEAAIIVCSHGTGIVQVSPSQSLLTVDGSPVLVRDDLKNREVKDCNGSPPCVQTVDITLGAAGLLTVNGSPVLLETATGTTNIGIWQVLSPGQTTLDAD